MPKSQDEQIHELEDEVTHELIEVEKDIHKSLDKFIYIVGILGPISAVFLIYQIFAGVNSPVLSLVTWGGFLAMATMWFTYGIINRHKPIVISYGLWMFTLAIVFFGVFFYS